MNKKKHKHKRGEGSEDQRRYSGNEGEDGYGEKKLLHSAILEWRHVAHTCLLIYIFVGMWTLWGAHEVLLQCGLLWCAL